MTPLDPPREPVIDIEQDGPRYRWVLICSDRRIAKGGQWWNSRDEAEDAADEFLEALGRMGGDE